MKRTSNSCENPSHLWDGEDLIWREVEKRIDGAGEKIGGVGGFSQEHDRGLWSKVQQFYSVSVQILIYARRKNNIKGLVERGRVDDCNSVGKNPACKHLATGTWVQVHAPWLRNTQGASAFSHTPGFR